MVNEPTKEEYLQKVQERKTRLRETCNEFFNDEKKEQVLEIGCGHGHFLVAYARAFPQKNCIGLDLQSRRIECALKKKELTNLNTIHFIKASAEEFLDIVPDTFLFKEIYLLFLDPWPKKRHFKNRIIQTPFLSELARKVESNGKVYFRTDHEEYFKWSQDIFQAHPNWEILLGNRLPIEEETIFQKKMGNFQTLVAQKTKT